MKNTISRLLMLVVCSTMLIAASKPSIEGRASIAESGELPPGMYIKAHTFLPGDSVIITNPATKVSIEVFVFETIDEGVAAIVSEEVAEKLFITNNSDTLVQIQKVVVQTEIDTAEIEIIEETTIVSEATEEIMDDSELFIPEEIVVGEPAAVEVETVEEILIEETPIIVEEIIQEKVQAVASEESTVEPEVVAQIETAEVPVTEETLITEITDIIVAQEEESTEEDVVFTPFSDMTSLFSTEGYALVEETSEVETEVQEIEDTVVLEEAIIIEEEMIELPMDETIVLVEEPIIEEDVVVAAETLVTEEDVVVEEPVFDDEITIVEEVFIAELPNTLTPTEENPPVNEGITEESEVTFLIEIIEEEVIEPFEETETVDIFALTPAIEVVEEPAYTLNYSDYIIDSISAVGNKKYYVQLATYKNTSNIDTVLRTYSDKYPLALVESTVVEDAYQVIVGPLTKDEYTVVLERFKSYGYKDAFLRIAEK